MNDYMWMIGFRSMLHFSKLAPILYSIGPVYEAAKFL